MIIIILIILYFQSPKFLLYFQLFKEEASLYIWYKKEYLGYLRTESDKDEQYLNILLKLVPFDTFQFSNDLISDKDEQYQNIKL